MHRFVVEKHLSKRMGTRPGITSAFAFSSYRRGRPIRCCPSGLSADDQACRPDSAGERTCHEDAHTRLAGCPHCHPRAPPDQRPPPPRTGKIPIAGKPTATVQTRRGAATPSTMGPTRAVRSANGCAPVRGDFLLGNKADALEIRYGERGNQERRHDPHRFCAARPCHASQERWLFKEMM